MSKNDDDENKARKTNLAARRKWRSRNQNIAAKVLSARLAKVLNLLITSPTTLLYNGREHVAKFGETKQKTTNRDKSGGSR